MIAFAVLGCALFAGAIAFKVLNAPSRDEPTDQFSQPHGDVIHVPEVMTVHHDGGDFIGWVHGERE